MSKPKIDKSYVDPLSPKDRKKWADGSHAEAMEVLEKVSPSIKKTTTLAIVLPESKPEQVEELLLSFASVEEVHHRLALVFQAAQGACLLRLREQHGHLKGGGATSTRCGGESWEAYIKAKFKFSDEKARRLMLVWKGMEKHLSKLSHGDKQRFLDFLRRPMILLPPAEVKILEKITHKITDAETQHEFLLECGFIGQAHGHALKNAKRNGEGGDEPATKATPESLIQDELWLPIIGGGDGTLSTIWDGINNLVKAWNKPTKDGALKAPLWQFMDDAKKRVIMTNLQNNRDITVAKLDSMIVQIRESLGKDKRK